ncbi:MAG: hypothetical protein IJ168_04840 [Eubacterium sp.]|nr:hypothetical protein [Eubacterium sp.]
MGFLDNVPTTPAPAGNGVRDIVFAAMPSDLEGFKALPQAAMATPFDTAALTVLALCYYPKNKELSLAMLDYLKGPRPLSTYDKQFIRDRFMDKDYVPRSYFNGATPQNDYEPATPYTVRVSENPYSYNEENYAKLYITSGGADSPRYVQLRLGKDGKWYLWEQFLLADIRPPESTNPWA